MSDANYIFFMDLQVPPQITKIHIHIQMDEYRTPNAFMIYAPIEEQSNALAEAYLH